MSRELEERLRDVGQGTTSLNWAAECHHAADTIRRYREALEYYAAGIGWSEQQDNGETARQALQEPTS